MSSNDEFKEIQFTWKIKNFSFLYNVKKLVSSPRFGTNISEFQVTICSYADYIGMFFVLYENCTINDLNCSAACLDCDGLPLIIEDIKLQYICNNTSKTSMSNFEKLIQSNKSKYLPNDTLTLQFRIWRTAQGLITPVSLFALTRIEPNVKVIEKTFIWDIYNASSLRPPQSYERRETITDDGYLTMKLTLNEHEDFFLELTTSILEIHAKIKMALLNASGNKIEIPNSEHDFYKQSEKWNFFTNVSKSMLMNNPNKFLLSDTLSLQFTCTFTGYVIFNRMVNKSLFLANFPRISAASKKISEASVYANEPEINQSSKPHYLNTISQTLQEVLNEGFLSDFNLRVEDRVFPVHKVILGARSQVFRAMFTTEMKEKEDNFVDIQDVDEDTLNRLLQFVYSDKLDEDMGWESASTLYSAADKYALHPLKQRCSAILQSGFCVSSVLEVLSMADMHQDQNLKSAALDFISLNDQVIIGSERWKEFEEENAKLALETCRNLFLKKMNG